MRLSNFDIELAIHWIYATNVVFFWLGFYNVAVTTVNVIQRLSSFTGWERPQVPLHAIFQAQVGT